MVEDQVHKLAQANYSDSDSPWPEYDNWHEETFRKESAIVESWLGKLAKNDSLILNAGSGGTDYRSPGDFVHLDIIENYVCHHEKYLVGSVEQIDSPDQTFDGVVCVGSVLNYTDAQRSIMEFSRVLKPDGFLILEFERTESAEFLFTHNYGKDVFLKSYKYCDQTHLLWMYSETYIRRLLGFYGFGIKQNRRIHSLSSLLYRLGFSDEKAASYAKLDKLLQLFSFPIAHNALLLCSKKVVPQ